VSFHDHNEEQRLQALLPLLREGKEVALVSDAGMPGLSDPGFSLVRACAAEGIPVTVLPGASAVSTALVISAVPGDRFVFVGFLARGKRKMQAQLEVFEGTGAALVAFESPRRVRSSLAAIAERWPERRLALCRELTKVHEEVVRGTAAEVLSILGERVRGELVLVLEAHGEAGGARPPGVSCNYPGSVADAVGRGHLEKRAQTALLELVKSGMGTKAAARIIADLTGLSSRRAYSLALEAKKQLAE
jgi:16S rRNA (cytidine1402-2'-O)-methyltransferase